MIIDGYSYDILKQINPQNVRLYLSSCGWQLEEKRAKAQVFSYPATGDVVSIPNDREFVDYAYRMEEAVNTISSAESKSVQRVVAGLTLASATDTIEYHYEPQGGEIGLIPLRDMEGILESGNNLNNYAYRDMIDYRPFYGSSRWSGKEILDDIRIGPALPGSYIVQFVYPAIERRPPNTTLDGGIAMDRLELHNICDKVERSLAAVVDAAERNRSEIDPDLNISYNFVKSVMGLKFDSADVTVRRTRIIGKKEEAPAPVTLSRKIFGGISEIEMGMRPEENPSESVFVGKITRMVDPRKTVNDEPAEATMVFLDDSNKMRKASFMLSGDDLNSAHDAFKARKDVAVRGVLKTNGKASRIEDIARFRILDV